MKRLSKEKLNQLTKVTLDNIQEGAMVMDEFGNDGVIYDYNSKTQMVRVYGDQFGIYCINENSNIYEPLYYCIHD